LHVTEAIEPAGEPGVHLLLAWAIARMVRHDRRMRRSLDSMRIGVRVLQVALLLPAALSAQPVDLRSLTLMRWTAEEDLRLGSVDGTNDAFVRPYIRAIGDDGYIYVSDTGIPALRVFDSQGRFVRQIGAQGAGPGEYQNIAAAGLKGDTVWVSDPATGRVTLFDRQGQLLESFRVYFRAGERRPTGIPVDVLGPERFLVVSPTGPVMADLAPGPVRFTQSLLVTDRAGTRVDTMVTYNVEVPAVRVFPDQGAVAQFRTPAELLDGPLVTYMPERDLVREVHRRATADASVGEFRILFRTRDGRVVRERRFLYRPFPLPPSVRDGVLARAGSNPRLAQQIRPHLSFPAFQRPVTAMLASRDGMHWIQREPYLERGRECLVLDADLSPRAIIALPPRAIGFSGPITRDHFWLLESDDLDVLYLVRYRIVRP
jgi:hypothetical protein